MTVEPAPDTSHEPRLRPRLGLAVVCLGMIAAPLDSAVNIAFPSITEAFALPVQDIIWVVVSYVLTYASLLLVFGKLGDLVGHRIVFQAGLLVSALGFAACALASRYDLLLVGRMVQGVGIALVLSCAPALATSLFDERERTRVLGVYASVTALGGALGPLVGGVLVAWLGWTIVFSARLPLVLVALALSWLIPATRGHGKPSGIDPLGSIQLVVALSAILLALAARPDMISGLTRASFVAGGLVLLAAFLRRQARTPVPIIRPVLFRDPTFALMNLASVIVNMAAFSIILIGPYYLVRIAGLETGLAGLVLALAAIGTIVGSSLAPRIVVRFGGTTTAIVGVFLSVAGLAGVATFDAVTSVPMMSVPLIVQGFGVGLFYVAYADLVTATLPIADRGVAGSLTMVTRTIGIVGGAAGHAAVHRTAEAAALAAGAGEGDAFMAGFRAVFLGAAMVQLAALVLGFAIAARWRSQSVEPPRNSSATSIRSLEDDAR